MITQVPNWQSLTPQEILDYLLGNVITPNTRAWTFNGLVTQVSADFSAKIELSLKLLANANVPFATSSFNALSVGGLPLWEPHVDTLIATLAAASQSLPEQLRWDEQTVAVAKGLGKTITPRWQSLGYQTEPTIESVQSELDQLADQAARQAISETLYGPEWNTHIAPVLDGDRNTATVANLVAGLRALADALEVQ